MDISQIDEMEERERFADLQSAFDAQACEDGDYEPELLPDVDMDHLHFTHSLVAAGVSGSVSAPAQLEETEAAVQLARRLHESEVRTRAAELRLNHALLQVSALRSDSDELYRELEDLRFGAVEAEEQRLLLEARLAQVSAFEQPSSSSMSSSLLDLRGDLLHAANEQIRRMAGEARVLRDGLRERDREEGEELAARAHENAALREQLGALSDQLAQRTVLYAAHERRWREEARGRQVLEEGLQTEVVSLRARLQQLERQHADTDRARVEALLESRQRAEAGARLERELREERARLEAVDEELAEAGAQNLALASAVERLRGADMESLERGMVAEVEAVRAQGRRRDEELRRELAGARELLASEAARREALLDDLERTKRDRDDKAALLRALQHAQDSDAEDAEADSQASAGAMSASVAVRGGLVHPRVSRRYVTTADEVEGEDGTGTGEGEASGGLEEVLWGAAGRILASPELRAGAASPAHALLALRALLLSQSADGSGDVSGAASHVDESFLVGGSRGGHWGEEEEDAGDAMATLAAELEHSRAREHSLEQAFKDQSGNMALILRRAAELEAVVEGRVRSEVEGRVRSEHAEALSREVRGLERRLAQAVDERRAASAQLESCLCELGVQEAELQRRCAAQAAEEARHGEREAALGGEADALRALLSRLAARLSGAFGPSPAHTEGLLLPHRVEALLDAYMSAAHAHAGATQPHSQSEQQQAGLREARRALGGLRRELGALRSELARGLGETQTFAASELRAYLARSDKLREVTGLREQSAGEAQALRAEMLALQTLIEHRMQEHSGHIAALGDAHAQDKERALAAVRAECEQRVAAATDASRAELARQRKAYREKVRVRLGQIRSQFEAERRDMLELVRAECGVILREAQAMLASKEQQQAQTDESRGGNTDSGGDAGEDAALFARRIYPEMISPEQTLELVHSVLRRSQSLSEEEWREMYVSAQQSRRALRRQHKQQRTKQ